MFSEDTRRHAIDVLHDAISKHGMPASILTDRGSQFYASESEHKKKGVSEFEQELVRLGIWHILARCEGGGWRREGEGTTAHGFG